MAADDPKALNAAALRRLRLNLHHAKQLDTFNEQLLMKAEQIFTRLEGDTTGELTIHNIVSQATGEGRLDVRWGETLTQVSIEKAREIGWMFFEAAAVAQSEADMLRFMVERLGMPRERLGAVLYDLRQFRKDPVPPEKGHQIPDVEPPPMPEPEHEGGVS